MSRSILLPVFLLFLFLENSTAQTAVEKIIPPHFLPQLLALNGDIPTEQYPKYLSPTALAASSDGKYLYIAEKQMKQVAQFDCASKSVVKTFAVPNEPTGVAIAKDGETIYVTCASDRWPSGIVCVISTATGTVEKRIAAGHYARSPVLSSDGKTLYTCNWLGNDVSVIDLDAGDEKKRIAMVREPYAAALTPDGATLVVTNSLPEQKATDTVTLTGKVSLVSTATATVDAVIPVFPVGTHSLFGVCISNDGAYAFVTHLVGKYKLPATTLTGGWVHTNNLAIIDIGEKKLINDVALDYSTLGVSNPWGIAQTGDGRFLCVLHSGSQNMSVIDYAELISIAREEGKDLSHDFGGVYNIKSAVNLPLRSPRSIAMIGNKAFIIGDFSDSLYSISISELSPDMGSRYALGEFKPLRGERLGEFNYDDANNCFQKWQSCFSCHPFGRPDALNWMLASEATKQRNAKSMLYSWWTPPTAWNGRRPHAGGPDGSIRMGIYYELMITPTEEIGLPLDTFLMRMKPVSSPFLVKGKLSASAERGRGIYKKIGCGSCHPAPIYTDNEFYNAGVPDPDDVSLDWNTPTLIEAWRTAPYGHLGSYDKIQEIIQLRAHSIGASKLSEQEMKDLVEFVSSL
jgi:DNA-binding beta-propeller fold protein YncE